MKNALIIGGASSGSGKTTFTIGLLKVLRRRGIDVQAFKSGPDYIDPMFHEFVTKQKSYNLPAYMLSDETIQYLFDKRINNHDLALIEGVMGYYDGHSVDGLEGSTAYLASLLNINSLLIFDASSMSLSAAAIVKGFENFMGHTKIKGVVLNNVSSAMHYQMLKTGIENNTGVKCYGYIPKIKEIEIKSRHLGLLQASEIADLGYKLMILAEQIEKTVDVDGILEDYNFESFVPVANYSDHSAELQDTLTQISQHVQSVGGIRLGVAMDQAFSFYYQENLETLKEVGVEVVPFSPIEDNALPEGLDALYIGGGYPEVFASQLSLNKDMLHAIKDALDEGMPAYAECGGLMYLTEIVEDVDGYPYEMVGYFEANSLMTQKLQRFGHVNVTLAHDFSDERINNLMPIHFKAHEFHKSVIVETSDITKVYETSKRSKTWECGYLKENCLATYAHNHFYSNLDFLNFLVHLWSTRK